MKFLKPEEFLAEVLVAYQLVQARVHNDLKRRSTGLSPDDYRAIKSEFIVRVLGR